MMLSKKNSCWVIVSVLLVVTLFLVHFSVPSPLFSDDGQNHFDFVNVENCASGYSNGICVFFGWANLSEFGFWFIFFVISLCIPLLIAWYSKRIELFALFFVFTGFFWNTMAMQVFAQIILSLFLVVFLFEPRQKVRVGLLVGLLVLLFFGVKFHNTGLIFLLFVFFVECLIFVKNIAIKEFEKNPDMWGLLGCGLLPSGITNRISGLTSSIREPLNTNVFDFFTGFFYYTYSFFVENFPIVFVVPGIYQIFKEKAFREFGYLVFIVFAALMAWFWLGWQHWWVTRIFIWVPLVLFVPFMNWLGEQKGFVRNGFWFMGLAYFVFNYWYFLQRMQELGCFVD